MEREWHIESGMEFDLANINGIYLPSKEYEELIRNEFPYYQGHFMSLRILMFS